MSLYPFEHIIHVFFPSFLCLLIYSPVHSYLNKFYPYALPSAARVASVQDTERRTRTLHSSCVQARRESSQENAAFQHPDAGAMRRCSVEVPCGPCGPDPSGAACEIAKGRGPPI